MKKLIPLVVLVLLLLTAGCDLAGINLTTTTQSAAINSFGASPPSVAAGESSTLSWSVAGATTVNIDQGVGNVALSGSRVVMPTATTVYTLTATTAAGVSVTATAQVMVTGSSTPSTPTTPPTYGLPVINYFTASPSEIYAGSSTILSWDVTNATSASIDHGVGTVSISGNKLVSPGTTTVYTLTAANTTGYYTRAVTVYVSGVPSPPLFSVSGVIASVNPSIISGPCPIDIYSEAVITVNGAGTVTYRWEDSEGGIKPTENVYFSSAGSQSVGTWWPVGLSGTFWVRLHVLTPNETLSNQASFTLNCGSAQTGGWAGTWDSNWGTLVLTQTGDSLSGTYTWDNGQIDGQISGNSFWGIWSEAPSYSPPDDAGEVQWTLSADGNSFTGQWRYGLSGDWDGTWSGTKPP